MRKINGIFFIAFVVFCLNVNAEETYEIDTTHAEIGFSVSHLVISKVRGRFKEFSGILTLDKDNVVVSAESTINVSSIDTGVKKRDEHLRSADFFDVEKFPSITFKDVSTGERDGQKALIGKFTIRDVTKELVLPYTIKGPIMDPWGNKKIGFEASTTIKRKDYGVAWNMQTETGGLVVGEDVKIVLDFEATKK